MGVMEGLVDPCNQNQPSVPRVKLHPSPASMRCWKVRVVSEPAEDALVGSGPVVRASVEVAPGGAEMEAVDQPQIMPECVSEEAQSEACWRKQE